MIPLILYGKIYPPLPLAKTYSMPLAKGKVRRRREKLIDG